MKCLQAPEKITYLVVVQKNKKINKSSVWSELWLDGSESFHVPWKHHTHTHTPLSTQRVEWVFWRCTQPQTLKEEV